MEIGEDCWFLDGGVESDWNYGELQFGGKYVLMNTSQHHERKYLKR